MTPTLSTPYVGLSALDQVPDVAWDSLATKRIYFGHQSVGYNIIQGIEEIMRRKPQIRLRILESSDPRALAEPVFAHSRVGANCDPDSKIKAFADYIAAGGAEKADIAFFKFCYVDIDADSDPERVFALYSQTLDGLANSNPRAVFPRLTVPLTTPEKGLKAVIKRLLGRRLRGYEDNRRRGIFNDLIRKKYGPSDRVLDLASAEATSPDGSRETVFWQGRRYEALSPRYTDDGGHLGAVGRVAIAGRMLTWLATIGTEQAG